MANPDQPTKHKLDQEVTDLFASVKESLQASISGGLDSLQENLLPFISLNPSTISSDITSNRDKPQAIADGRQIYRKTGLKDMKNKEYDVVLDLSTGKLLVRLDPASRSPLVERHLTGLGKTRMKLLRWMLEHPFRLVHTLMLHEIDEEWDMVSSNTLAARISCFRKILGNDYIQTEKALGIDASATYRMNPDWQYLVIHNSPVS